MKKTFYLLPWAIMMLIASSLCSLFSSCSKDKEDEPEKSLNVYPWVDYPESYIRLFDYRMDFRMLSVKRNGTSLQIEYTLTNIGFGKDITLSFYLNQAAGHDNLGNTYTCTASASSSDVIATINGGVYGIYGQGRQVEFLPNQTIRGSFIIKDFDINATAFSMSVNVKPVKPSDLILAADRMDFVNIPVEQQEE